MTPLELILKDLETNLAGVVARLKTDIGGIRGNRPSPDAIENLTLSLYDQTLKVRELGSISVLPPRTIQITVWDKDAVNPIIKAIEAAHMGLTASNDGTTILQRFRRLAMNAGTSSRSSSKRRRKPRAFNFVPAATIL